MAGSIAEVQLEKYYSVDLSDFRTGRYVLSENGPLGQLNADDRRSIDQAIERSKFKNLTLLRNAFEQEICSVSNEDGSGTSIEASSVHIAPILATISSFREMIVENGAVTEKVAKILLSSFLSDFEKDGTITAEQKEQINLDEVVTRIQKNENKIGVREMTEIMNLLLKQFIQ